MKRMITTLVLAATMVLAMASVALAESDGPTCATELGVANHAEHVLGDYVRDGGTNAAGGAKLPGGAGPAFHFSQNVDDDPAGPIPPGASFCTGANSGAIFTNPGWMKHDPTP